MDFNFIQIFLLLLFFVVALKNSLFWTAIWQIKEYRFDRFWNYLTTPEGKKSIFSKSSILEFLALFAVIIFFAPKAHQPPAEIINQLISQLLILTVFLIETILLIWHLKNQRLTKPVFTKKALLIVAVSVIFALAISLLIFYFWPTIFLLGLLIITLFVPSLVSLTILLFYPLSFYLKQRIIKQAKKKITKTPDLKIIGIAGSYGKTSVKEFTYQLLKNHFKVAKTEKNNNTEIGVAQTINKLDLAGFDVFIVEMGAYKVGEIKQICQLAKPDIGVLTGIDQQHSALFGGLTKIIQAKSEIIANTKNGGTIILNYANNYIRQITLPNNVKPTSYGINSNVDLVATKTNVNNGRQSFTVKYQNQEEDFSTQLIGRHNILNLLAALAVALTLDLTLNQLKEDVINIQMVDQTLKLIKKEKLILLDDSYNANPTGVLAGLEAIIQFSYDKIIVLDDILELGREAKKIHLEIADALAKIEEEKIILVGKNYSDLIKQRLLELNISSDKILAETENSEKIYNYLSSISREEKVILFEGRGAQKYLEFFNK